LGLEKHPPLTESVYYIMLSLVSPRHGYGIMQHIHEISNGRVKMGPGTLYGAIKTLLERGWIEHVKANPDSRKKQYMLTEEGKNVVKAEINRLQELLYNGKQMMGGELNNA